MRPVDLFHVGPQKSATTFVYECLRRHPDVACPQEYSIHYFDMHYHRGTEWYAGFFEHAGPRQKLFDPTFTYIRSSRAPRRIARHNPDARIVLCLRDPIERAFSHYWHDKKKGKHRFRFDEVFENYDLFASWIEPSFYAEHIERYLRHFPRDQILCVRFGDLERDSRSFLRTILEFAGVDVDRVPDDVVDRRVNPAGGRWTVFNYFWRRARRLLDRAGLGDAARQLEDLPGLGALVADRREYERGPHPDVYRELRELLEPEIQRLEDLLDESFEEWRAPPRRWDHGE